MPTPNTHHPVSLVGVPLDLGAKNLGVDIGPDAFRYAGIAEKLESAGLTVTDHGNLAVADRANLAPGNPHLRYADEIIRVSEASAQLAHQLIAKGQRTIGLGGDHSITLGLVSGAAAAVDGQLGLIYLDAHGDMNTEDTTLSGNIHGMHVASLLGLGTPKLTRVHTAGTKIAKTNFLHIGGCDWDQGELDLIEREDLTTFTQFDFLKSGLAPLLKLIDELAARVSHIYVSLDLDVIDQVYAPGAGMPNARGFTYREVTAIAEYIGRTCDVVGLDIAEYNPLHDDNGRTAELGIELIALFLGHNYSWYTNYLAKNQIG